MQAFEFYATPVNGFIPIPERYRSKIKKDIKVIILDNWVDEYNSDDASIRRKTDLLLPPSLDTQGWRFNKEEANER
jgi:hypothetical protein